MAVPELPYPLPKPAEVLKFDLRPPPDKRPAVPEDKPIKLLQWNIERGYKLEAIIEELRNLDADVLALQEIDIHCERSGWADTGLEIAKALGLSYVFVCEFEELHSPLRAADTQGGGVHGNAILSKYDIIEARALEHTSHPVDWELPPEKQPHPLARKEPRHGRRLTAAATVATPQGPLLVYSAHLECFCGALLRMAQLSDIFRDTRQQDRLLLASQPTSNEQPPQPQPQMGKEEDEEDQQDQQPTQAAPAAAAASADGPTTIPRVAPAALMGDLNTLANGVARLSPNYCNDWLRWGSLGWFEAEVLKYKVLDVQDPQPLNTWARRQGLPEAVCRDLVNPGYEDPYNCRTDITFDHVKYRWLGRSFMTGKLDWVLLRGCRVVSRAMGNDDYSASDHKWLLVEVHLVEQHGQGQH